MSHPDPTFDIRDREEQKSTLEELIAANFTETNLRLDNLLDELRAIDRILKEMNETLK